jgi:hypothetical protein
MIALDERRRHQEVWLLLPWLANGRLSGEERETAEEHVQRCKTCESELESQLLMCRAFTEPDRVVYAPGPSFRKLMDRIDGVREGSAIRNAPRGKRAAVRSLADRFGHVSLWRPPGLAWAASFLLLFGITGMMTTAYHYWAEKTYLTRTDEPAAVAPNVLHIALDRSLPIGEVNELLRANGARIVEGPSHTGELGVMPNGVVPGQSTSANTNRQLRALAGRLRTDPRVLWVQPLADEGTPADQRAPDAAGQRAPDVQEH